MAALAGCGLLGGSDAPLPTLSSGAAAAPACTPSGDAQADPCTRDLVEGNEAYDGETPVAGDDSARATAALPLVQAAITTAAAGSGGVDEVSQALFDAGFRDVQAAAADGATTYVVVIGSACVTGTVAPQAPGEATVATLAEGGCG
jgi:hypothetical protein